MDNETIKITETQIQDNSAQVLKGIQERKASTLKSSQKMQIHALHKN